MVSHVAPAAWTDAATASFVLQCFLTLSFLTAVRRNALFLIVFLMELIQRQVLSGHTWWFNKQKKNRGQLENLWHLIHSTLTDGESQESTEPGYYDLDDNPQYLRLLTSTSWLEVKSSCPRYPPPLRAAAHSNGSA